MSTTVYWTTNNNLKFNEVFQYVHEYLCVYIENTIVSRLLMYKKSLKTHNKINRLHT